MQEEEKTIPQMVDDFRTGKLPRRRFIKTSVQGHNRQAGFSLEKEAFQQLQQVRRKDAPGYAGQ